jgi:hypothetical protein
MNITHFSSTKETACTITVLHFQLTDSIVLPSSNGYLCVSVETQKELQLIGRNIKDETSGSEDEEASPDIGHDICLETYTGSVTVTTLNWQTTSAHFLYSFFTL